MKLNNNALFYRTARRTRLVNLPYFHPRGGIRF